MQNINIILKKLTVPTLVQKFPAFYGTRRFMIVFTTACHLSLVSAKIIQSTPTESISAEPIYF